MNKPIITSFFSFLVFTVFAQEKRTFRYKEEVITFLAQNNRSANHFSFPGMNVYIIVGDKSYTPERLYDEDKFRQLPVSGMKDYTCFYYITYNHWLKDSSIIGFLKQFIAVNYAKDFFNRNRVCIVWLAKDEVVTCDTLKELNTIIAGIDAISKNKMSECNSLVNVYSTVEDSGFRNGSCKTSVIYTVPGLLEMEKIKDAEKARQIAANASGWKNNLFVQLTAGSHSIGNQYKTDFDTATLVDFSKYKTIWNISAGYYLTNKLAMYLTGGFIYTGKQKNIDGISFGGGSGITIRGSGYAGAMIRYGLGVRFLPYNEKKLSFFLDLSAGGVKVIAGGGNATRTIGGGGSGSTNIIKKRENAIFYAVSGGFNYRLSNTFYFTSNLHYNISPLKNAIGSVKAFTGFSMTFGIGLTFPVKDKINE